MVKIPRALILEPRDQWQIPWRDQLKGIVELIFADSLDEAELLFDNVTDIDIIVITCSDLRNMEKTKEWIRNIHNCFGGAIIPILVASELPGTQQAFTDVNCKVGCGRDLVPGKILDELRL